jgi:Mg2+ and Co2+ transporter CorA
MSDIEELERRISAAFDRIGQAVDGLVPAASGISTEALQDALLAEQTTNAQLTERLRIVIEREASQAAEAAGTRDRLTRALDAQGQELQRMKKTVIQLRESLAALRAAQTGAVADPHLVNKAMLTELEALRATRLTEMAQMEEILAELHPLIGELQDA